MKIIFLDFDGVVNRFDEPESLRHLSPSCVEHLNVLVERTGAKIVVTSTWRLSVARSLADLRQVLVNAGFKYPKAVIGKTPEIPGAHRGEEISAWLKRTREKVEAFVILDDDSDMEPFMDWLIRTDSNTGLTLDDVERTIRLLNQSMNYQADKEGKGWVRS